MAIDIVEYAMQKKDSSALFFDNDKNRPKSKGVSLDSKKAVCAFDFETLTKDGKAQPAMLGFHMVKPQRGSYETHKSFTGAIHDETGEKYYKKERKHRGSIRESWYPNKPNNDSKKWFDMDNYDEKRIILLQCLRLMTNTTVRSKNAICFFYNLKYDFGMLCNMMNDDELTQLYTADKTQIYDPVKDITYEISLAGNKFFTISYKNEQNKKEIFKFYDLAVFMMTSLDKASKDWLGEELGGKTEGFDTKEIFNDVEKLKDNYVKAVDYCINDCEITAKLGKMAKEMFEDMEIPFTNPISPASLFKSYIAYHESELNMKTPDKPYNALSNEELEEIKNVSYFPRFLADGTFEKKMTTLKLENPSLYESKVTKREKWEDIQKMSYDGYFGGLFEFYRKGYFPHAVGFDYASMYPSIMKDLPHIEDLDTYDISNRTQEEKDDSIRKNDWAVIKAKVWCKEGKIMLFPVKAKTKNHDNGKTQDKIIRPVLQGQTTTMTKQMYEFFCDKYPHFDGIEIEKAYVMQEKPVSYNKEKGEWEARRPFKFLQSLFNERLRIIDEFGKGDKRQLVIKIILNAGYGVMAETVEKNNSTLDDDGSIIYDTNTIEAGKLTRPFYAMHITEFARLKIYDDIFSADIENDVIGVATDCIFLDGEAIDRFKNARKDNGEEVVNTTGKKILGKLEIEKEGELLVIGNGLYQFKDIEEGYIEKTTRGFNEKQFPNLFEEENQHLSEIPVENERPTSWKEVAMSLAHAEDKHRLASEINVFNDDSKVCDLNVDTSREWEYNYKKVADLFEYQSDSKPLMLKEVEVC